MAKLKKDLSCPACGFNSTARVVRRHYRFLLFQCPTCNKNVVFYAGKTGTLSDELIGMLFLHKYLSPCGDMVMGPSIPDKAIENLHNLLASEQDFDRILSQL
jgi:predicted RNA-binding Zn-ribbon protein involved in translation (DUF1610 family)